MKKIKQIEIQAFRGFKNKAIFDFTHLESEDLADLIVLYAPNGFGKTSFYEAVEWGLTGKLIRFDKHESEIQHESADKQRGAIYRNFNASSNLPSYVRILSEDDSVLKRETRKTRESKYGSTDLREGNIVETGAFEGIERNEVISLILSQEKMDDFIRNKGPEEKYEVLKDYWNGEKDTLIYYKLSHLLKELRKRTDDKKELADFLKKQIKEIEESSSKIKELNIIIEQIKYLDKVEINQPNWEGKDSHKLFENDLINAKASLKLTLEKLENDLFMLEKLNEKFLAFKKGKEKLVTLKASRKKTQELLKLLSREEIVSEKVELLLEKLGDYKEHDVQLTYLQKNRDEYLKKYNEIQVKGQINDVPLENQKVSVENLIAKNKEQHKQNESKIKEILATKVLIEKHHKNTKENIVKIEKLTSSSTEALKKKNKYQSEKRLLEKKINFYKDILSVEEYIKSDSSIKYIAFPFYVQVKAQFEKLELLKKMLEGQDSKLKERIELSEELDHLLELSLLRVEKEHAENCPICATHFGFKKLIEQIKSVKRKSKDIDELKDSIAKQKANIAVEEKIFQKQQLTLRNEIEKNIIECRQKILQYENLMGEVQNILQKNSREKDERNNQLNENLEFFKVHYEIQDISEIVDVNQFNVKREINIKSRLIDNLYKENEKLSVNLETCKKELGNVETQEFELKELINTSFYTDYQSRIENLNLNIQKINKEKEYLDELKSNNSKKIKNLQESQSQFNKEQKGISEKVGQNDLQSVSKEDFDLQETTKEIEISIKKFEKDFNLQFEQQTIALKHIKTKIRALKVEHPVLTRIQELISNAFGYLDYGKNIHNKSSIESRLDEANKNLKKLTTGVKKIDDAKRIVVNRIESGIASGFNEDTINDICRRIDPHPEFQVVKFEPDFEDDNKLKIRIKIREPNGNERKDPTIYNSSGQVNVLSLSIYLAKALQNTNGKLNTLFMDDPIQFLDGINSLSFIDLIRVLITRHDRQLVVSTHDKNFYKLMQRKLDSKYYKSRFWELNSYGMLKQ